MFKQAIEQISTFFKTNLGKQVKIYTYFYFALWIFHLIIISLVSFFHLLLGHSIGTIGDWIGDRGWTLIIFSKLFVFYLALQFIRLKSKKINLIKSYISNGVQLPRKEIFVILLFLICGLMGLGKVGLNHSLIFEFSRIFIAAFGTFIFFSVDFALVIIGETFYPLQQREESNKKLFLFPLLFYGFTYATYIYEQSVSFKLYAYFLFLLYLSEWRRRNWTLPMLFLTFFIVPSYVFWGLDPVWSSNYTVLSMEKNISSFSHFLLVGISLAYLELSMRRKPEYIYRD